ncbi:MAG: polysaccharide deacetylase family protein [Miltoncostaeaceae bacterium]
MRKRQAVQRTAVTGVALAAATARLARHRPLAAAALLSAGAAAGAAAYMPRNPLFGRAIGAGPAQRPEVAITFDDGPGPSTAAVLDALAAAGAVATFFVLGREVAAHAATVRRIVAEGHQLASHGWDHGILIFRGPRHVADQLRRTERAVAAVAGEGALTRMFRAPHGFRGPATAAAARAAGYRMAAWTHGVFDSAEPGADVILARSVRALAPGTVLLLHDADGWAPGTPRPQTVAALPAILAAASARGLRPVRLDTMAGARR